MQRFKNWLIRVMTGRNGPDDLARVCTAAGCAMLLLSLVLRAGVWHLLCNTAGISAIVYGYFRMFSRNIYKRRQENAGYVRWRSGVKTWLRQWRTRCVQSKDHRFFRCPGCRTVARVPRGRGRIEITCPHCGQHFIRKS